MGADEGAAFFQSSRLPQSDLAEIWGLADVREPLGQLHKDEFFVACKLVAWRQGGGSISTEGLAGARPPLPRLGALLDEHGAGDEHVREAQPVATDAAAASEPTVGESSVDDAAATMVDAPPPAAQSLDITALRHALQESRAREASAVRACEEAKAEADVLRQQLAKLNAGAATAGGGARPTEQRQQLTTTVVVGPRTATRRSGLFGCLGGRDAELDPFSGRTWHAQRAHTGRHKLSGSDRAVLTMHQAALHRALNLSSRQTSGVQLAVKHEHGADGRAPRTGSRWRSYWVVQYGALLLFYARSDATEALTGPRILALTHDSASEADELGARPGAVRVLTRNSGTFLLVPSDPAATASLMGQLLQPRPAVLDTCHFSDNDGTPGGNVDAFRALQRTIVSAPSMRFLRVLMLGMSGAGKSTILWRMKPDLPTPRGPTLRAVSADIRWTSELSYKVTDAVGSEPQDWPTHYMPKPDAGFLAPYAIVFVVDSIDQANLSSARRELDRLLECEELKDTVIVVAANKQGYNEKVIRPPPGACAAAC